MLDPSKVYRGNVLSDRGTAVPDHLLHFELRHHNAFGSSPIGAEAGSRFRNAADQQRAFTSIVASPNQFLSCAQARRSIKRGCRSFLVLVSPADSEPTVATAGVTDSTAVHQTSAAGDDAEHADLHKHIDTLQHDFADVFATPSGLPPDRGDEHVISLIPNCQRMYRLAPSEVQRQITELLSQQLIEPSISPYGAPVLFVKNRTGELCMVVDYRALNKVKNRYPLPRIDDLFDKLFGAKYFSCLDAASGFHQILLKEADKPKIAFKTPCFFFFLGGKDIHYTSAMIATSRVCDVHHKPKRPKLTTHLEWFRHES